MTLGSKKSAIMSPSFEMAANEIAFTATASSTGALEGPQSILVAYQMRRENRALLDKVNEQSNALAREKKEREEMEKALFEKLYDLERKVQETQATFNATVAESAAVDPELKKMLDGIGGAPDVPASKANNKKGDEERPLTSSKGSKVADSGGAVTDGNTSSEMYDWLRLRGMSTGEMSHVEIKALREHLANPDSPKGRGPVPKPAISEEERRPPVDLPVDENGRPSQNDLDVEEYFDLCCQFALRNCIHQEKDEDQTAFIVSIMRGMKKTERSEIVRYLVKEGVAEFLDKNNKKSVSFVTDWDDFASTVYKDSILKEAKAKAALLNAKMADE